MHGLERIIAVNEKAQREWNDLLELDGKRGVCDVSAHRIAEVLIVTVGN